MNIQPVKTLYMNGIKKQINMDEYYENYIRWYEYHTALEERPTSDEEGLVEDLTPPFCNR